MTEVGTAAHGMHKVAYGAQPKLVVPPLVLHVVRRNRGTLPERIMEVEFFSTCFVEKEGHSRAPFHNCFRECK